MRRIHFTIGHHARALADLTHASKVMGRLLISLVAFVMIAMMWTERFLTWDKFLQGGQDLELNLVALIVFLCLIILLAQRSQQAVAFQLSDAGILFAIIGLWRGLRFGSLAHLSSRIRPVTAFETMPHAAVAGVCPVPLRI